MLDAPLATDPRPPDPRLDALLTRAEVDAFNAAYCAALDHDRLYDWTACFTEDAFYTVTSRENADHAWPVGLIHCEGRAMLRDRAFAIQRTAMYAPRYLRHVVGNLAVAPTRPDGLIPATASYVVFEVLMDRPEARLHQVGEYRDLFRRVDGRLLLAERRCVYDNLLIPTALCLPV